jgi:hypothetical protein
MPAVVSAIMSAVGAKIIMPETSRRHVPGSDIMRSGYNGRRPPESIDPHVAAALRRPISIDPRVSRSRTRRPVCGISRRRREDSRAVASDVDADRQTRLGEHRTASDQCDCQYFQFAFHFGTSSCPAIRQAWNQSQIVEITSLDKHLGGFWWCLATAAVVLHRFPQEGNLPAQFEPEERVWSKR